MIPGTLFARMLRVYLESQAQPDGTLIQRCTAPAADLGAMLGVRPAERRLLVEAVDQMLMVGVLVWGPDRRLLVVASERRRARTPAERAAAYRERQRVTERHEERHGGVTENVTSSVTDRDEKRDGGRDVGSPPLPLSSSSGSGSDSGIPESSSALSSSSNPVGSAREPAKPRPRKPNAVPVPEPFPVDAVLDYGRSKGLTETQTRAQCEALVLWAKAKAERKVDWIAAAQGWIRRHVDEPVGRNGFAKPPGLVEHESRRTGPLDPQQRLRLADTFRTMLRDPELTPAQHEEAKRKLRELEKNP